MFLAMMMAICVCLFSCSKPIDNLQNIQKIALISVIYDPTIYTFRPHEYIDKSLVFASFTGSQKQRMFHEHQLNEFLIQLMAKTAATNIAIVRPLMFVNTSLLQDKDQFIRYEYLLDPYDPIDTRNHVFMANLANRIGVDAVISMTISFAIYTDKKSLWEEINDPYSYPSSSYQIQLRAGHKASKLRVSIAVSVIDSYAKEVYSETRFVDFVSDKVSISDTDLRFPGGVSPALIELGLTDWLHDWARYISSL